MAVIMLSPEEGDEVVALWEVCGLTRPWNDAPRDFQRAASGSASAVLGVRDGAALIATVMVGHDGHRGWVYYLAVHPDWRLCAHGRTLMAAAEAWLAEHGVPKLNLMVRGDNDAARGFYAALGYAQDDVVVLARRLDGA